MRQKSWYLTIGTGLTACMLAFPALGLFWPIDQPYQWEGAESK